MIETGKSQTTARSTPDLAAGGLHLCGTLYIGVLVGASETPLTPDIITVAQRGLNSR